MFWRKAVVGVGCGVVSPEGGGGRRCRRVWVRFEIRRVPPGVWDVRGRVEKVW